MRARRHTIKMINEPIHMDNVKAKRVLVVNDDENDRRAIEDILGKEYDIIFASNGEAAIDVFDMEPPLPKDYPLLGAKNILLSPHIGFASQEAMVRRAAIVFENVACWLEDKPRNIIK